MRLIFTVVLLSLCCVTLPSIGQNSQSIDRLTGLLVGTWDSKKLVQQFVDPYQGKQKLVEESPLSFGDIHFYPNQKFYFKSVGSKNNSEKVWENYGSWKIIQKKGKPELVLYNRSTKPSFDEEATDVYVPINFKGKSKIRIHWEIRFVTVVDGKEVVSIDQENTYVEYKRVK